jgi:hypothetical protein
MQYLPLLLALLLFACGQGNKPANTAELEDSLKVADSLHEKYAVNMAELPARVKSHPTKDTLYQLLDAAKKQDSIEFFSAGENFLFIKAGYILSAKTKHAVLIYDNKEDVFFTEIYALDPQQNHNLLFKHALKEFSPINLNLRFSDYNFDGYTDLYLQKGVSNGMAISFGNLYLYNGKGIKYHPECYNLGNMEPDKRTRTIISDERITCTIDGLTTSYIICKLTHKWKNEKLLFIKKQCPCEPEN